MSKISKRGTYIVTITGLIGLFGLVKLSKRNFDTSDIVSIARAVFLYRAYSNA